MPTYSYACTACGHRFDAQQPFTDAALTECPECAGRLRKLFGAVGVVFKGSGFYRTDSRAGSTGKVGATKGSSSTTSGSSGTTSGSSGSAGTNGTATPASSTPAATSSSGSAAASA